VIQGDISIRGLVMQIALFFVLWLVFWLSVPTIVHLLFGSSEYPLVSLSAVVSFVGGALLAALLTGLFKGGR
jgi:uncharacterized integral membrane protein